MYKIFCESCYNGERDFAKSTFVYNAVAAFSGLPRDAVVIEYGRAGKPFVLNPEGLYISVSHSGSLASVIVSDTPVGIDIERIRAYHPRIPLHFTASEQRYLANGDIERFFEIWCAKEALLKLSGKGLSGGLSSFSVCDEQGLLNEVEGCFISVRIEAGICTAVAYTNTTFR